MADIVTVKVLAAFDGMRLGESVQVELTPRIKSIVACGLLKVVDGGTGTGGPDSNSPRRKTKRTRRDRSGDAADGEPGAGFGAGGYGAPAGIDPQSGT